MLSLLIDGNDVFTGDTLFKGSVGGVRAQYHLRHMCVGLNCFVMNTPQVYIGEAAKKFDANLKLIDEGVRGELTKFLAAFKDYIRRLQR